MIQELDRLSEKVELARNTIVKLREEIARLQGEAQALREELSAFKAVADTIELQALP